MATSAAYTMPITATNATHFPYFTVALGNNVMLNRINPYVPIFSITPASSTDPAVGASVCASGSHVCSGKSGTLIANAIAKPKNNHVSIVVDMGTVSSSLH